MTEASSESSCQVFPELSGGDHDDDTNVAGHNSTAVYDEISIDGTGRAYSNAHKLAGSENGNAWIIIVTRHVSTLMLVIAPKLLEAHLPRGG